MMVAASQPVQSAGDSLSITRLAAPAETLTVLPLVRAWHAESLYRHLPFLERKLLTQVMKALARKDDGATFYALWRGEAVGLIDLAAGEAWLCEGGRYATCLAWFVRADIRASLLGGRVARLLLDQAKGWATATGADLLFLNATHGPRKSFARMGVLMGENVAISFGTRARKPEMDVP